ncbi:MAG: hypothetical protein Ta2D_12550 [Rickettsiales bacterium]|nr:MAG: hypothetical protein Ta2D_12550 [Rickettsiales bacterium]
MLNIALKSRLEKRIFPLLPIDIRNQDEQKKLSYSFIIFSLSTILNKDYNEVLEYITDGSGDNGIDAVYIEDNNIAFFQFKYNSNDKPIGENESKKVIQSVVDIIDNKPIVNASPLLKEKIRDINVLQDGSGILNINVYFVSNSENEVIDANSKKFLNERFDDEYKNYKEFNIKDLYSILDVNTKNSNCEVEIIANGKGFSADVAGIRTFLINISASELIKMYESCKKERIFSNNVRFYLKNSRINKAIKDTICDKDFSRYFCLFNNGISIIADKVEAPEHFQDSNGNRKIKILNPSIINGGQTTRSIYDVYQSSISNSLNDIQILVRIYETTNSEIIEKITIGTNSQNAINLRDLQSNEQEQKRIQEFFADKNIGLEIKRGEFNNESNKTEFDKTIKNDELFQRYMTLYEEKPHLARGSKTALFNKNFNEILKNKDKELPEKFFRSYEVWDFVFTKQINMPKEELNKKPFIIYANFSIMFAMSLLDKNILDIKIPLNIDNIYNDVITIIEKVVKEEQKELGDRYSNNDFFKSPNSTTKIKKVLENNL